MNELISSVGSILFSAVIIIFAYADSLPIARRWRRALSRHKVDDRGRFPRAADSTNYNLYAVDAIERPIAGIM